ncbi:MAG: hypothetical protein HY908_14825 [Myxococcales bacterium]|nr:hypothetical protein [Myxococcales bacterium]
MSRRLAVRSTLALLLALDVGLTAWGFFFPELWFRLFHGAAYEDPQGLLRRCAANWLAFAILQALALVRWERAPGWLLAVAGMRLGDALTDLTCLAFAASVTPFALAAFPLAGVGNVVAGAWLWRQHGRLARPSSPVA